MSDPYLGEIKINAFNFAPRYWAECDGQTMTINQNAALYSLLGVYYGGDQRTYFKLPDMRGRTPIDFGYATTTPTSYSLGEVVGAETVAVSIGAMPAHNHECYGIAAAGTTLAPAGNLYGQVPSGATAIYVENPTALTPLHPSTIAASGSSQNHNNMQPSLVLNFCICTSGTYPPRQ